MDLEVLPAAKGDCLLLHHGMEADPKLIVIDGGPAGVYSRALRPRLLAIREERINRGILDEDDPLPIDLLLVSHIDDDHINGVKALLTDIRQGSAPFRVLRLWHNGFDSLVGIDDELPTAIQGRAVTASLAGDAPNSFTGPSAAAEHDLWKVLASVKQGVDVLALAKALTIPINAEFASPLILAGDTAVNLDGLVVTVLGPLRAELADLRAEFADWLRKGAKSATLTASFSDDSVTNLSSIVLLVEGEGQKLLLTGDARGDKVMDAAASLGLLDEDGRLPVDIHKVPHHGSDRNLDERYFRMFPAPRFVFSGNGEHGNPERAAFAYLVAALAGTGTVVQLTYSPDEIDAGRATEWARHHAAPFDVASQGIASYLAQHPTLTIESPPPRR